MTANLVIVESPAKAKTIKKYLGKDFEVLASYGHVRDLVPKEGAVDPQHDFRMQYQLIERNERHVNAIARALRKPTRSSESRSSLRENFRPWMNVDQGTMSDWPLAFTRTLRPAAALLSGRYTMRPRSMPALLNVRFAEELAEADTFSPISVYGT